VNFADVRLAVASRTETLAIREPLSGVVPVAANHDPQLAFVLEPQQASLVAAARAFVLQGRVQAMTP